MGSARNTHSDSTELQPEEKTNPGGYFRKYTVLTAEERSASSETLFKKYAPARDDSPQFVDQQSPEALAIAIQGSNASLIRWSKGRTPIQVWWVVASLILIAAGWMILTVLLRSREPVVQQTKSVTPPAAGEETAGASAVPDTEAPLASTEDSSSTEDQKDLSRFFRSRRAGIASPGLVLNLMQARAREFEDRGMLVRAEAEYRTVAASFPGDRFSQDGLSRVQGALLATRENEKLRASREVGLRNFRMGDYSGAERELSAALNGGRADTATLYALGMSYIKLENYTQAKSVLERCIAMSPNYAPALVGLAQTNIAAGRREQALPLLRQALELGGGAEFTPAKIEDMISGLDSERPASSGTRSTSDSERAQPTFFAHAVHVHDLLLASCNGNLQIVNSVVHFNASTPSHSFHVLSSEVKARVSGDTLYLSVTGNRYRFKLKERPVKEFLNALVSR